MNKLRLIKIYELRKQVHPIEAAIIDLLDGINYSNEIYSEDGITFDVYMTLIKFGCSYEETSEIMKYLLEKHLNITINDIE